MQLQFNSYIIELLDGYTNANLDPRASNYEVGRNAELDRAVTTVQAPAKPLV